MTDAEEVDHTARTLFCATHDPSWVHRARVMSGAWDSGTWMTKYRNEVLRNRAEVDHG